VYILETSNTFSSKNISEKFLLFSFFKSKAVSIRLGFVYHLIQLTELSHCHSVKRLCKKFKRKIYQKNSGISFSDAKLMEKTRREFIS